MAPLRADDRDHSAEFRRMVAASSARVDGPVLYSGCPGRPEVDTLLGTDLFIRATCDSSRIPSHWIAPLNRARAIIVPSPYVAEVFRSCGVTPPIHIVPSGVDPRFCSPCDRSGRKTLTTLMIGMMESRTDNYRQGIEAWQEAFDDDPDARLVVKSWQGWPDCHTAADPRIHIETLSGPARTSPNWYDEADVLLALGNEGCGTSVLEGMAAGLPVIALAAEGQADICRAAADAILPVPPVTWRPYEHPYGEPEHGVVGVPEVDDIAARLRWVADNRRAATELGRRAAAWTRRHRDIWNCAPEVLTVIAEHTHHKRFPFRDRTLPPSAPPLLTKTSPRQKVSQVGAPPLWTYRPSEPTPLGLVTLWSPDIDHWARPYAEDKQNYCERHGFAFYGYTDVFTTDRAPHWSKIPAVERHLGEHDWLYWIDADAVITNFDFDLRALCDDDYDLIVTHDELGLNSGSFLIRNNDVTGELLRLAWKQDVTALFYERTAMTRAIALLPRLRVKVLEKRTMNSFWNEHRPGDFIMHAAGQPTDVKIALLNAFRDHALGR
ncbi:glycosyltransferase [Nocardia sp. NPDC004068]|uniref:glycosyltransferase n=1 Tax=Nocardia sp. NPDC004068 TaxID=3364303 RepID=UPI0036C4CAB0